MPVNPAHALHSASRWLAALPRRKRHAALWLLGAGAALAMPPYYVLPLLLVAFTGLQWALRGATTRARRFWDGWWFGWGFFIVGNYWIAISMLTDVSQFGWLIPFTVFGLTGLLAIFYALACVAAGEMKCSALPHSLSFAGVWSFTEWLRGHVLTGFPWNLPGYALSFSDAAVQPAAWLGVYGLSFLLLLAACIPASLVCPDDVPGRLSPRGKLATFAAWSLLAVCIMAGALRLYQADLTPQDARYVPGVKLRLVQADILQHHKWNPALQMRGVEQHIQLSLLSQGLDDVTHIIWPETAVPYALPRESRLLSLLSPVAPAKGALITGSLRSEGEGEQFRIWNSLIALRADGQLAASYDKHRLVPFGEFVPLHFMIPVGATDFSNGPGPRTLDIPGAPPASPLICYEAIFPGLAVDAKTRPGWLLNITNDAWFGASSGPYQHFAMSRMRAVEQGLPLVRAANTGISAVTDGYGRLIGKLDLGQKGILDARLPVALPPTPYAQWGDWPALLLMAAALFPALRRRFKA